MTDRRNPSRLARLASLLCAMLAVIAASVAPGMPASAQASRAAAGQPAPVQPLARGSRPNILLILADDMGYTDLGVYGSEIPTPNLDRLAATGTILTNYYSAPLCAPTRAMLLSGTDHHRAGEGLMSRPVEGAPGYEGRLNDQVVSLATRLRDAGYHTYMAGKWHLGDEPEHQPKARGFERSFALLEGGADHFSLAPVPPMTAAHYIDDGTPVSELPDDFYSTISYTDHMLGYMRAGAQDDKPFFAYLAYTSPHWPIQALDADLAEQRGKYDDGYEVLRQRRFEAWKSLGYEINTTLMPNLPPAYRPWTSLSPQQKAVSSRTMEAYAAMIARMDREIGRILDYLEATGQLDNTLIIFQSDNGAEGGGPNDPDTPLDQVGRRGSTVSIGSEWATAAGAPHSMLKYFGEQGGVNVPAIVNGPGVPAGRSNSLLVGYDIAPTLLELAGVDPYVSPRPGALSITGKSFLPLLAGNLAYQAHGLDEALGWEHDGEAALRKGDWKLVWTDYSKNTPPRDIKEGFTGGRGEPPTVASLSAGGTLGDPVGPGGPWRLYNVTQDPAELYDQSARYPAKVAELMRDWLDYARRNQFIVKEGDGE